eukprot:8341633-Alexandrium_andersonii.AAC.1
MPDRGMRTAVSTVVRRPPPAAGGGVCSHFFLPARAQWRAGLRRRATVVDEVGASRRCEARGAKLISG